MKKSIVIVLFYLMSFILFSFDLLAQDMARVSVTINSLKAISNDACGGKMDFFARIFIDGKMKSFPVREGNNLQGLNWQYSITTPKDFVTVKIEIWDDDDAVCGGKDDRVCVDDYSDVITKTYNSRENKNLDFSTRGRCGWGALEPLNDHEVASITYNITIEPTRTAYITQSVWKEVKKELKTTSGVWREFETVPPPACVTDNYYVFHKNVTFQLNEGDTKCSATNPQIIRSGRWSFQNNENQLLLIMPGSSVALIYRVSWIDENKMILTASSTSNGVTTYTRSTYRH